MVKDISKKPVKEVRSWSILNSQRSVLYPFRALFIYSVSNCIFSLTLYTTCSQVLYLFICLLIPQMMNCAQESMHEYLLLNEFKNSIKKMRPHQLFVGFFFQLSLVLFNGISHTMENHSTVTEHLVRCCLTYHPKM